MKTRGPSFPKESNSVVLVGDLETSVLDKRTSSLSCRQQADHILMVRSSDSSQKVAS